MQGQIAWIALYLAVVKCSEEEQLCSCPESYDAFITKRRKSLGSVTRIIRSNGATVFSAQYDPWGVQTVTTNTIAFSRGYCSHEMLNGDLVISLDTVRTNAELFHKTYEEELYRVIIHGVLHLCGINDKGPGERELMEAAENKALKTLPLPSL